MNTDDPVKLFRFAVLVEPPKPLKGMELSRKPQDLLTWHYKHLPLQSAAWCLANGKYAYAGALDDACSTLRTFYAEKISPVLGGLEKAFELCRTLELRFPLQLKEDGVHLFDNPDLYRIAKEGSAVYPYTEEGVGALVEHLEGLLNTLLRRNEEAAAKKRRQAERAEKNKPFQSFVHKYNIQRARLGLPPATISEIEQGLEISVPNGDGTSFTAHLIRGIPEKLMADLRMFRKNNPGLETRLLKEKAGLRAL